MIFADVHGKLGSNSSRAHELSEDLLTSTAFGLLRYLPEREGLLALLRRARVVTPDSGPTWARRIAGWISYDQAGLSCFVRFWPSFGGHGEPDVLLTLAEGDRPVHVVLVEVKYLSPKSGWAADDDDALADEDVPDPDQLVKYWHGLMRQPLCRAGVPASLIYLTAGQAPPVHELCSALRRCPLMRLGWLSWYDVAAVAEDAARRSPACLPAQDLVCTSATRGSAPSPVSTSPRRCRSMSRPHDVTRGSMCGHPRPRRTPRRVRRRRIGGTCATTHGPSPTLPRSGADHERRPRTRHHGGHAVPDRRP